MESLKRLKRLKQGDEEVKWRLGNLDYSYSAYSALIIEYKVDSILDIVNT